jgi:two-component system chemotaxis response regulator CheB
VFLADRRGFGNPAQALEAGAVDVILKPRAGVADFLAEQNQRIRDVVKGAAHAKVSRRADRVPLRPEGKLTADAVLPPPIARAMSRTTEMVVCIGASTGGTEALREVLEALPANAPGIVVVQHMPEQFTRSFAARLNARCEVDVKEAEDGDTVMRGHVLIAPGGRHTLLRGRARAMSFRCAKGRWSRATALRSTCCSALPRNGPGPMRSA